MSWVELAEAAATSAVISVPVSLFWRRRVEAARAQWRPLMRLVQQEAGAASERARRAAAAVRLSEAALDGERFARETDNQVSQWLLAEARWYAKAFWDDEDYDGRGPCPLPWVTA